MSRPNDPAMCPVCRTRNCQKRRHLELNAGLQARQVVRLADGGRADA